MNNEPNNPNKGTKNQDQAADAGKQKTNQDFPGYPHYPAKDDMLKAGNEQNLSTDDKSFSSPADGKKEPPYPHKEELRGEMDEDSEKLPGNKKGKE